MVLLSVAAAPRPPRADLNSIQRHIDDLASRLAIAIAVEATIVEANPLVVSVEPDGNNRNRFVMSFEDGFLERLNEGELRAVIAHELGHVWIFTHHPYLQTERLANSIALRVVSRDALEQVYVKLWERSGAKEDLEKFLGR